MPCLVSLPPPHLSPSFSLSHTHTILYFHLPEHWDTDCFYIVRNPLNSLIITLLATCYSCSPPNHDDFSWLCFSLYFLIFFLGSSATQDLSRTFRYHIIGKQNSVEGHVALAFQKELRKNFQHTSPRTSLSHLLRSGRRCSNINSQHYEPPDSLQILSLVRMKLEDRGGESLGMLGFWERKWSL